MTGETLLALFRHAELVHAAGFRGRVQLPPRPVGASDATACALLVAVDALLAAVQKTHGPIEQGAQLPHVEGLRRLAAQVRAELRGAAPVVVQPVAVVASEVREAMAALWRFANEHESALSRAGERLPPRPVAFDAPEARATLRAHAFVSAAIGHTAPDLIRRMHPYAERVAEIFPELAQEASDARRAAQDPGVRAQLDAAREGELAAEKSAADAKTRPARTRKSA